MFGSSAGGGVFTRKEPNMVGRLWIDIETRSRVNLKKCGVYRYVRCPDFRILMASWATDPEGPITTALSY